MKNIRLKHFTEYFLSFLISFLLFVILFLGVVYFYFSTPNAMISQVKSNNVEKNLQIDLDQEVNGMAIGAGFKPNTFNGTFTQTEITEFAISYINNTYKNQKNNLITQAKKKIESRINKYIKDNNINRDDYSTNYLNSFIDQAATLYTNGVEIPYFKQFVQRIQLFKNLVLAILSFLLVIVILLIFFLWKLNKYPHHFFRFLSYSTLTAGLMTLLLPLIAIYTKYIGRLNIRQRSIYLLITGYLNSLIRILTLLGIGLLVLGLFWIVLSSFLRKKVISNNSEREY